MRPTWQKVGSGGSQQMLTGRGRHKERKGGREELKGCGPNVKEGPRSGRRGKALNLVGPPGKQCRDPTATDTQDGSRKTQDTGRSSSRCADPAPPPWRPPATLTPQGSH